MRDGLRIMYTSVATSLMSHQELEDLLLMSRARNAVRGITGLMLYEGGRFAQVIEGPRKAVCDLFAKIECDPRHAEINNMLFGEANERAFGDWSMGFSNLEQTRDLNAAPLLAFMADNSATDPTTAFRYLVEFSRSLET